MQEKTTIFISTVLPVRVNEWSGKCIFSSIHVNYVQVNFVWVKGCTA